MANTVDTTAMREGTKGGPTRVDVLLNSEPLPLDGAVAVSVRIPGWAAPLPASQFELGSALGVDGINPLGAVDLAHLQHLLPLNLSNLNRGAHLATFACWA